MTTMIKIPYRFEAMSQPTPAELTCTCDKPARSYGGSCGKCGKTIAEPVPAPMSPTPTPAATRAAEEIYEAISHFDGPNVETLAAIIDAHVPACPSESPGCERQGGLSGKDERLGEARRLIERFVDDANADNRGTELWKEARAFLAEKGGVE